MDRDVLRSILLLSIALVPIASSCTAQPFDMAVSYQAIERHDIEEAASIAHVDFSHPIEGQESLFVPDPEPGETELYVYPFGLSVEIDPMDAGPSLILACGEDHILLEQGEWLSYSSGDLPFDDFLYGAPLSICVGGGWEVPPFSIENFLFTPGPLTGLRPELSGTAAEPVQVPASEDFTISWDPGEGDSFVIYIMTEDGAGNFLELLRHGARDDLGEATIPATYLQSLTAGATAMITVARRNMGEPFTLPNGGLAESESVVTIRGVGVVE